eukprot:TRINITY_DN3307_c0_g1_i1.p1 TRINITY_DN3307_c0_g1~~TRINITY_DN3307_c0_g1_i1.p1  ORF type:complete len:157 (+),score=48.32 TRINITY_DN3307_c0_g1_i1:162-632(+)
MPTNNIKRQLEQEAQIDTSAELEGFHKQFLKEIQYGTPSVGTIFTYACFLIKSPIKEHKEQGVAYFTELLEKDPDNREYLYFLALGNYTMEEPTQAKYWVQQLLQVEPHNPQALELQELILEQIKQDGLLGMAIVGGAATVLAVGGIVLAAVLKKR